MADRSGYQTDLMTAMAGSPSAGAPAGASFVRPLAQSRSFSEAFARQRERRATRELTIAAGATGNTAAVRLARNAERTAARGDAASPGMPAEVLAPGRGQSRIWVNGFTRADGTRVEGYWRINPNPADGPIETPLMHAAGAFFARRYPDGRPGEPMAPQGGALLRRVGEALAPLAAFSNLRPTYVPLGVEERVGGVWHYRDAAGNLVAADPATDIRAPSEALIYRRRDPAPPYPAAAEAAQRTNIAGRALGAIGLDDDAGTRRNTTWAQAWRNTVEGASLINPLHSAMVAFSRAITEDYPSESPIPGQLAMEVAGTLAATGAVVPRPAGSLGMSGSRPPRAQMTAATDLNPLGLYSRVSRAIDQLVVRSADGTQVDMRGTPQDMLNRLDAILGPNSVAAREEMRWSGLRQFLEERAAAAARPGSNTPNRITRAQIRDFFDRNRVEIVQRTLGGPDDPPIPTSHQSYALNPGPSSRERLFQWMRPGEQESLERIGDLRYRRQQARIETGEYDREAGIFRGGQAAVDAINVAVEAAEAEHLRNYPHLPGSHWQAYPGLAGGHVRTSDQRVRMPDGRNLRAQHIDESQSDWGQRFRNREGASERLAVIEPELNAINQRIEAISQRVEQDARLPPNASEGQVYEAIVQRGGNDAWRAIRNEWEQLHSRQTLLGEERALARNQMAVLADPGPLVTNTSHWVDFQIATQLMQAARNPRAQAVTLMTGEEVARRFGQYDQAQFNPSTGRIQFGESSDIVLHALGLPEAERLAAVERYAQHLNDAERQVFLREARAGRVVDINAAPTAEGLGNIAFYDRIARQRLQRMVRGVDPDARVVMGTIRERGARGSRAPTRAVPVHVVEMTPQLRERLVAGGLPIMANPATAAIPGAVMAASSQGSRAADARERAGRFNRMLRRARGL